MSEDWLRIPYGRVEHAWRRVPLSTETRPIYQTACGAHAWGRLPDPPNGLREWPKCRACLDALAKEGA